ncbi:NFIL3 protein, partial [Amia calva]|nr:NFIL3 protein [Amia calva]
MPDEKKDASYWEKRRKNNEAAKRSREKRRVNDFVLESRLLALSEENVRLRAELLALKLRFGLLSPATYASHQHTLLQLRSLPPPQHSPPSLADSMGGREIYWGRRCSDSGSSQGEAAPAPSHSYHDPPTIQRRNGSAFTPTRSTLGAGYNYKYPTFPSTPPPLLPPPLAPLPPPLHPAPRRASSPMHWPCPPRPQLHPTSKAASDEEAEQQVPAPSEADPKMALPHKLRLKMRVPREKADSDSEAAAVERHRGKAAASPTEAIERLCVSD